VIGALYDAATACGYVASDGQRATMATINSGLSKGQQTPRVIPDEREAPAGSLYTRGKEAAEPRSLIAATPYTWKEPSTIARREWLYGRLLIRKFVTATVSPGGVGKSSLIAVEALAKVSGKDLLGVAPAQQLRVWLWNLEDPQEETERKIQAAALHYGLSSDDVGARLFVDSGRDQPLVIATATRNGATIARPLVDALTAEIIARGIDVVVIDPLVSCHEVGENDNTAMDMVVKRQDDLSQQQVNAPKPQ
jgi:hypothetical protein